MVTYIFNMLPLAIVIYWLISGRLMVNPNHPRFTVLTPVRKAWSAFQFRRHRKRYKSDLQEILDAR